jgi:hypothetical protein
MSNNYRAIYEGSQYLIAKEMAGKYTIIDKKDGSVVNEIEYYRGTDIDEEDIWIYKGIDARCCGKILVDESRIEIRYIVHEGSFIQRTYDFYGIKSGGLDDIMILDPDNTGRTEYIYATGWSLAEDRCVVLSRYINGERLNNNVIKFERQVVWIQLIRKNGEVYLVGSDTGGFRNYIVKLLEKTDGRYKWLNNGAEVFVTEIEEDKRSLDEYERMDRIK